MILMKWDSTLSLLNLKYVLLLKIKLGVDHDIQVELLDENVLENHNFTLNNYQCNKTK